VHGNPAVQE